MQQTLYKPKKEKVKPVPKREQKDIVLEDVLHWASRKVWDQRVFILVTVLILENVYLLVR